MEIVNKILANKYLLFALGSFSVLMILIIIISLCLLIFRKSWLSQKAYFVGKELIKIYSNATSYFSQKRIQQGILFFGGYYILIDHYIKIRSTISTMETVEIATLLFAFAGYTLKKVQDEKKDYLPNTPQ